MQRASVLNCPLCSLRLLQKVNNRTNITTIAQCLQVWTGVSQPPPPELLRRSPHQGDDCVHRLGAQVELRLAQPD